MIPNSVSKKAREFLKGDDKPRTFGPPGDAWKEQRCEEIQTYLVCRGHFTSEKKWISLAPDATLEDARTAFGRSMRQQKILDEAGFELPPEKPLSKFSKNCNLSLIFAFSGQKEAEAAVNAATTAAKVVTDKTKIAAKTTASMVVGPTKAAWQATAGLVLGSSNKEDSKKEPYQIP